MTQRERFLSLMRFDTVDRVPLMEVQLIMVDCDGCVRELLPLWREAGIGGTHPPDMPWETYRYHVERRREVLGTPGA